MEFYCIISKPFSGFLQLYVVGVGEYVLGPTAYDFDNPLTWMQMTSSSPASGQRDIIAYSANSRTYMVARGENLRTGMFKG